VSPHPVESYALTRNQSEGSILRNRDQQDKAAGEEGAAGPSVNVPQDDPSLPSSYQQRQGNRAYTEGAKGVDNLLKSSDLGYASDVCDYNVATSVKQQPHRPISQLVSQHHRHLKPTSPLLENSLYDRRMKLIRKRASVFINGDTNGFGSSKERSSAAAAAGKSIDATMPKAATTTMTTHAVNINAFLCLERSNLSVSSKALGNCNESNSNFQTRNSQGNQSDQGQTSHLGVPRQVSQQSSTEDEAGVNRQDSGDVSPGDRKSSTLTRKNSKASSSSSSTGVRAKIARRKMMRQANSIDNPQGSLLSDQDGNTEDDDEEEDEHSIEEKQDSEPINEKNLDMRNKSSPGRSYLEAQLTPETARKNWESRFANIKHSFEDASEDDLSKSRSPSINRSIVGLTTHITTLPPTVDDLTRQPHVVQQPQKVDEVSRGRMRGRPGPGGPDRMSNIRSRSAHNLKTNQTPAVVVHHERAPSKEDKNKMNSMRAAHSGGSGSDYSSSDNQKSSGNHPSGRDSVDYHQYLEMIERFRGNNPKVYNRPLQKNVPTVPNSKVLARENPVRTVATLGVTPVVPLSMQGQRLSKSQPRENCDPKDRAEVLGLVKSDQRPDHRSAVSLRQNTGPHTDHAKNHDMDYQEYMNIINKVRKTKEFTRVRTEQIRLASMYAQEKKRQDEIKLEEERLKKEREKIEKEREEARRKRTIPATRTGPTGASLTDSNRSSFQDYEKGQLDNDESEQTKLSPSRSPLRTVPPQGDGQNRTVMAHATTESGQQQRQNEQQQKRQEKARMEQIRQEQLEQKRQQELRELQVKGEQEKLQKLREEQMKQEKEREEINSLELERLQQIQEEQRRLEDERRRQEESIRIEQARLEEERKRQERIRSEKNAQYNRQRLDMEAQNLALLNEDQRVVRMSQGGIMSTEMSPEERMMRDRLTQQDKLREEHKREETQIRKEKLNLLQQEEMLIRRQEEMLRQIEAERVNLTKQEDLIRSRQQGRLLHVRQEKQLLEKQEEMLMMREQQLMQERVHQEKLRSEQKVLKEQEEAIRKRYEEISKELMMGGSSDQSDTGSETITMCNPREGQVFRGPHPIFSEVPQLPPVQPVVSLPQQETQNSFQPAMSTNSQSLTPPQRSDEESESEDTLDDEDYYETKVEVKQNPTSVPISVRTIETKLDNPAWAPITPYLSYQESRQNHEEISAILGRAKPHIGVVTSPESVRTSTNLITTPESSLQSQMSISSSCPGSPPPIPPLPMDQIGTFQPVQPDVPPRDDSFAAAAAVAYNNDMSVKNRSSERRSMVEEDDALTDLQDNKLSPRIGGPGSAFKPYASSENLFDASIVASMVNEPRSPEVISRGNGMRNGFGSHPNGKAIRQPIYSKVRELRKPVQHPFSTTDTEPEMRECNLPTHLIQDSKRKPPGQGKNKAPTYSTSETEEEYQAYLRSRHKWHGKGKSGDSWNPLLVESPPQIVQKPVGVIQKPKAHQATALMASVIERGTQAVNQTPVYIPSVPSPLVIGNGHQSKGSGGFQPLQQRIKKSDSIIEVRTNQLLPESVTEISRKSLVEEDVTPEPEDKRNNIVGASPPPPMQISAVPNNLTSDQIKSIQEKYLENVQASNSSQPSGQFGPSKPKVEIPFVSVMKDLHDKVMGEAIRKVEDKKETTKKKNFPSINRSNPTIAAMEIMTRKENAQNAMEERLMRDSGLNSKNKAPQGQQKLNTFVTASMNLRPISSPVASQSSKIVPQPVQKPAIKPQAAKATTPLAIRKGVPESSPVRKTLQTSQQQQVKALELQKQQVITRASQEHLRAQRNKKEEEERQKQQQEDAIWQLEQRQKQLEEQQIQQQEEQLEQQRLQRQKQEELQRRQEEEERHRRQQEDLQRRYEEDRNRRQQEELNRLEQERRQRQQEQEKMQQQQMIQKHNQLQQRQMQELQQKRVVNSAMANHQDQPLVKPHPSMLRSRSEQKITMELSIISQPAVIILKKQPKILALEEIRAKNNSVNRTKTMELDKTTKEADAVAATKAEGDVMILKNEAVRKAAERFERAAATIEDDDRGRPFVQQFGFQQKSRSKSIGHSLSQKMIELDMERERAEGTKSQMTSSMPWSSKPPALRRRDNNQRNYELRMSKSSDSITAAKLMAEARMNQQQREQSRGFGGVGGKAPGLRINQNMSSSMEKQIDVYTKTRDDIRRILQVNAFRFGVEY
jgi:hypothetical protein